MKLNIFILCALASFQLHAMNQQEYQTPPDLYRRAHAVFGSTLHDRVVPAFRQEQEKIALILLEIDFVLKDIFLHGYSWQRNIQYRHPKPHTIKDGILLQTDHESRYAFWTALCGLVFFPKEPINFAQNGRFMMQLGTEQLHGFELLNSQQRARDCLYSISRVRDTAVPALVFAVGDDELEPVKNS